MTQDNEPPISTCLEYRGYMIEAEQCDQGWEVAITLGPKFIYCSDGHLSLAEALLDAELAIDDDPITWAQLLRGLAYGD